MDLTQLQGLLGAALSHDVTKWTVALGIAAWLHSSQVRKEIKNQMASVVASIDNVAKTLGDELNELRKRIGSVENRVDTIEEKRKIGG